jgi:hypothetical protein
MKKYINHTLVCAALLGIPAVLCAQETSDKPMTREASQRVTVTATVEAIDLDKRELTLKNSMGNSVTFTVSPEVKRLNEVNVGDTVRADYLASFAAEIRKPTAEEEKNPLVVTGADGRAPADMPPAAAGARKLKVVTTIEGLDRRAQTVTVKGPRGHYLTARVADPSRLTQVRIGETIIITYTEAIAISLEKVDKKATE